MKRSRFYGESSFSFLHLKTRKPDSSVLFVSWHQSFLGLHRLVKRAQRAEAYEARSPDFTVHTQPVQSEAKPASAKAGTRIPMILLLETKSCVQSGKQEESSALHAISQTRRASSPKVRRLLPS